MAVALDAASAAQTFSNVTSKSWTHTASGSNRCVWVGVSFFGYPSDQTITAVTYDGVDITSSAFGSVYVNYGTEELYTVWYELKNPPTTTNATVAVTFSGSVYGVAGSISCTGVHQTTGHGTPATATGVSTATDPNITVTGTTSGNLVLGGVHNMPTGYTLTVDVGTQCWLGQERPGGGVWGGASRADGGGDKTLSWSIIDNNWWSASAFEAMASVDPPVNTVAPAVTGTAQVGQTLTTTTGTWTGSPTSYAYQWKRADDSGFTTNVTNIGTNQNTFVLTTSESGKYVRCVVTATNDGGSTAANSNITSQVPAAPVNTAAPAITPTPTTTGTLCTCTTGTWTGSPSSYSYQWKLDGSNVGTDASTYTPVAAGSLTCVVTATNAGGSTPASSSEVTVSAATPVTATHVGLSISVGL